MGTEISPLSTVAITMGDAAGIGPEITLKALSNPDNLAGCRCIIIGDLTHLRRLASVLDLPVILSPLGETDDESVSVVDLRNLPAEFDTGVDAAATGKASAEYIEAAVDLGGVVRSMRSARHLSVRRRSHWAGTTFQDIPSFWRSSPRQKDLR